MTLTLRRGDRLVIATHNEGKVRELAELFTPLGIECISAQSLGLAEPEETGDSFAANAGIKDGDIIVSIDGKVIDEEHPLDATLAQFSPGVAQAIEGTGPSQNISHPGIYCQALLA